MSDERDQEKEKKSVEKKHTASQFELPMPASVCNNCGNALLSYVMKCKKCNSRNEIKYCKGCGYPLHLTNTIHPNHCSALCKNWKGSPYHGE